MDVRRAFAILVILMVSLFAFGGWCVFYEHPRVYAVVHEEGVAAGRDGIPACACPYANNEKRFQWLSGWADGCRQRTHQ